MSLLASSLHIAAHAGRPQPRRAQARSSRRVAPRSRSPIRAVSFDGREEAPRTEVDSPPFKNIKSGIYGSVSSLGLGDELIRQEAGAWILMVLASSLQLAAATNVSAYLQGAQNCFQHEQFALCDSQRRFRSVVCSAHSC